MTYTQEQNEQYQLDKQGRNAIERQERKARKAGTIFHRSTKLAPTGKLVGITFTGKIDEIKQSKIKQRNQQRSK